MIQLLRVEGTAEEPGPYQFPRRLYEVNSAAEKLLPAHATVHNSDAPKGHKCTYGAVIKPLQSGDISWLEAVENNTKSWDKVLEHAHCLSLNKLDLKNLVRGLIKLRNKYHEVYTICAKEKHVRTLFKPKRGKQHFRTKDEIFQETVAFVKKIQSLEKNLIMSENQATFSIPDNTAIESSPVRNSKVNLSPNPKEDSSPHSTTIHTLSESTSPLSKSEDVCPPLVSPEKQSHQGEQGNLVQEPSTLSMAEHLSEEPVTNIEEYEISWTSDESEEGFEPQEGGTEEEGAIVPFEQPAQDDIIGDPNDEPDPSMENPGQESSYQVSVDPAPSPHFDVEPLNMVVHETNPDSEEDANDLVYSSFIRARTKPVVASGPPPKRPTTRLQQKEALESALKKSKRSKKGEVNVDEETKEEPSSLSRKSSRKKHSLSEKHTFKGAESSSKSGVAGSSKKVAKSSSDKIVKKHGDKSDEEEVEKSGEHRQSKLLEKEKSVSKLVKRKRDDEEEDKEPGSVKKGKVSETLRSDKTKRGNQKVMWGRTLASDILESAGMRQLVAMCDAQ
uniref:Protein IWS1 homolog n=1 Tax=Nicotiana tabacum TaxID=4097 RepID=A0A1S4C4V7_TOBAC|nr:PREDICTED: protein IWS1 homolog [Nicotiana tabacum]